ncbi:hypothetical protein RGCCGE502_21150 [Rhizobium grahamii CCGE 502]|uniref:Uncharacterized protein n=1 Tax=Rhizobium grahamii CCGE 502 TaxID=990285 RepID=S3IAD5_9HYPH|nr:hypothetical protein RGCCGE502_21150 [Rhizobium grahamii CCGE 502]
MLSRVQQAVLSSYQFKPRVFADLAEPIIHISDRSCSVRDSDNRMRIESRSERGKFRQHVLKIILARAFARP